MKQNGQWLSHVRTRSNPALCNSRPSGARSGLSTVTVSSSRPRATSTSRRGSSRRSWYWMTSRTISPLSESNSSPGRSPAPSAGEPAATATTRARWPVGMTAQSTGRSGEASIAADRSAFLGDVVADRREVGDLPRFDDPAVAEVDDDGLVDGERSSAAGHSTEVAHHRARDDDAGHLDIAVDDDLLHRMTQTWQRRQRITPDGLLR